MEWIQLVQHGTPWLAEIGSWSNLNQAWIGFSFDWVSQGNSLDWTHFQTVLAQQFDTDVFSTTRAVVGEFIQSGKLWTLLIGIVIGYILKGLTSYG